MWWQYSVQTWTGFNLEQMVVKPTTSEKSMLTEVKSSQVLIGSSPALQYKPTSKTINYFLNTQFEMP